MTNNVCYYYKKFLSVHYAFEHGAPTYLFEKMKDRCATCYKLGCGEEAINFSKPTYKWRGVYFFFHLFTLLPSLVLCTLGSEHLKKHPLVNLLPLPPLSFLLFCNRSGEWETLQEVQDSDQTIPLQCMNSKTPLEAVRLITRINLTYCGIADSDKVMSE